ncbi:MAG: TrkA C-terminal domain-containing protein [Campylobacterales bacterium]
MQKIVVIAGGNVAKRFLQRLKDASSDSIFFEIALCEEMSEDVEYPRNSSVKVFDPTSEHKLKSLSLREARVIFIALEDMTDAKIVARLARDENMGASIVVLDSEGLPPEFIDALKLKTINAKEVLSNTLMSFMPHTPLIAQNIGKGQGEIMEVMVPYGSKYVFRHISNIEQKNWKIAAIYRNEQLILPKQSTMIRPQDELILIGQPNILKDVYKAIKSEIGHFPQPFGANLYLCLDVSVMSEAKVKRLVADSLVLHEKLNSKKLFIKAFNINSPSVLTYLRGISGKGVIVEFEYRISEATEVIKNDVKKYNIGFVLCDKDTFKGDVKKTLFELKKPVLKFGKKRLFDESYSALVATSDPDLEKISYVFFDMSLQLKLALKLYQYDPEEGDKNEVAEHYISLSDVYGVKLQVEKESKNFFREYRGFGNFIQFLPFTEEQLSFRLKYFISPASSGLFALLKDSHQLFIPISDM